MSGKAEDAGAENMQSENMRQDDMRQDDMRAENAGSESGAAAKLTCGVSVAGVNAACIGSNAKPAAENARAESNISAKNAAAKKAAAKKAAAKNAAAESNAGAGEDAESAAGPAAEPDSVSGVSGRSPRLRFAGFTQPWQTRKLEDFGSSYGGLSGKNKDDFGHGDASFVTYKNVFLNPVADLDNVGSVEIDLSQNEVRYGDVFFTVSSEIPEEVGMSSVWVGKSENVYLNSFCFGYRPDDESVDPFFYGLYASF